MDKPETYPEHQVTLPTEDGTAVLILREDHGRRSGTCAVILPRHPDPIEGEWNVGVAPDHGDASVLSLHIDGLDSLTLDRLSERAVDQCGIADTYQYS